MTDRQAFGAVLGIVLTILALPIVLVRVYEFDNVVAEGERYGFAIGDSISDISSGIAANRDGQRWTRATVWRNDDEFSDFAISDLTLHDMTDAEVIDLQYGDSTLNNLRLSLENAELVEMYRSRYLFEWP